MTNNTPKVPTLEQLDKDAGHAFALPTKRIHDGDDVTAFLSSRAYADIMTFIFQLNTAMLPRKLPNKEDGTETAREWKLSDPDIPHHLPIIRNLANLLSALTSIIDEAPPDPGPRRFGNVSFRTWYDIVRDRLSGLLDQYLPQRVLDFRSTSDVSPKTELSAYLIGSFGSSQRLDYGTGHELSFLAFLGCLWKLGAFPASRDGEQERGIVLGVLEPYLVLVRRLISTYTLEPAGSHGVWGLDDHSFLPYVFGSAQFSPAIVSPEDVKAEGSLGDAPHPGDVAKASAVERERTRNMYFSAIGFIYDVKKGPFWEHSNILYDVSGVKAGWAKINKGMIKMYNAEVLSKFPVVQHFPFGSLFVFEPDPNAKAIQASVHTSSQPKAASMPTARPQPSLRDPLADPSAMSGTRVPGAVTRAPWATGSAGPAIPSGPNQPTKAPWSSRTPAPPPPPAGGTTAPWARGGGPPGTESSNGARGDMRNAPPSTRAPWADKR
ncbi:serine/threonine-protein phosphatase 2A activator 1 [Decorospora gaudefroyi]|uniref:Serine/threonine-protein phosphatase 2A activator n=1 Tax=Decorospora gaudefroyi TaxID=184978 RepID=A0A6A5JWI3_9PLEO|nr:serine/threonine-protein phosphatase 2A activator 1 [Decorospora gaudefroyi]